MSPKQLARVALLCLYGSAWAEAEPIEFFHKDWLTVCDNTRTCRMAGYQDETDDMPVSVLFTRSPGPDQAPRGLVKFGHRNDAWLAGMSAPWHAKLQVGGIAVGQIRVEPTEMMGELSSSQVQAVLQGLQQGKPIEWSFGNERWRLSGAGSTAAFLKSDEAQGRVGTPGALARKGTRSETQVLGPIPAPTVRQARIPPPTQTNGLPEPVPDALHKIIVERAGREPACDRDLLSGAGAQGPLVVSRIGSSKLLISTPCWRGAYNEGIAYWLANEKQPHDPVLITTSGTEFEDGVIRSSQKGRGLGDCWSTQAWVWDGLHFAHTESVTTGLCRMVAAGGAWIMPLVITKVIAPK